MKRIAILAIAAWALLAAQMLSAQGGPGGGTRPRPGSGAAGNQAAAGPPVVAAELSLQSHTISVGGRLQPQSRIVHKTTSGGYIQSLRVSEGQPVQEGQELLSLKRKDDVMNLYKPVPLVSRLAGRVSEVLVQVGDEVNPGDPAVVILDDSGYRLEATVSDKDAFRVDIGQGVSARGSDGTAIRGVLANRSQEPDYATGLFTLTFRFPDSQQVSIGEFVLVELPIDRARGLFVPRDVVVRRYGKYFLWIVGDDGRLEAREVRLGRAYGDLVRLEQGLEPGERYLARLTGREREGATVEAAGP